MMVAGSQEMSRPDVRKFDELSRELRDIDL